MPFSDNIVDAEPLLGSGSTTADITSATEETNENSLIGWPTVWGMIDLSAYPAGVDVEITLSATGDSGFEPYMEVLQVIDASFDPASPDFSKLDYMSGTSVGNGTTTDSSTFSLQGGTGVGTGFRSETGIFYVFFTDWNFAGTGSASIDYVVPDAPICVDAEDVINPDSPTATVQSGRVRESYDGYFVESNNPMTQRDAALKWTWAGPAGVYKVKSTGRIVAGSLASGGGVAIIIAVNGVPVVPVGFHAVSAPNTDFTFDNYPGFPTGGSVFEYTNDYGEAPWVALKGGDILETFIVSAKTDGSFNWVPFDLEYLCFYPDPLAPSSTYCTPVFQFPDAPLGDVYGSPNGWGGQVFVPDDIWTKLGTTPYDEGDFPWGVGVTDYDFSALEDGTVYAIVHDEITRTGGSSPFHRHSYIVVKKFNGSSWSEIAVLNIGDPEDGIPAEAVACHTDGDFVYFTWWELDVYTPGAPAREEWLWHCKRLDVSDDSIIELGTGQSARGVTISIQNYPEGILASSMVGGGSDLYVCATEYLDSNLNHFRLHVWHWNGSAWSDTGLPDPSVTDSGAYSVTGENGFYDVLSSMCVPPGGDLTLVYAYRYWTGSFNEYRLVTIEYNGSSWGNEIISSAMGIEGNRVATTSFDYDWVDMQLMWSDKLGSLVLATSFSQGASGNVWDVLKMGASDWEPVSAIAPGSAAGDWRQSRNTAAIGPDGEVYRAMMSEQDLGTEFYPMIVKTSDGYLTGFSQAGQPQPGESNEPGWTVWMFSTAHYRIRILGTTAYIMGNFSTWTYDYDTAVSFDEFADGIFMWKLTYKPCGQFRPHFYRRILG